MYTAQSFTGGIVPAGTGVLGAETTSAAAALHGEYLVMKSCLLKRVMFYVTTLVANDTIAAVVTFRKRLAFGVSSGQTTMGTLTLPDNTAVGKVLYKDVDLVDLKAGDTIALDHTTQGTDTGVAAGAGYYGYEIQDDPETAPNQGDFLASA